MLVYAEVFLGRLQQYSHCGLRKLRYKSSSGQEREINFKHSNSGLFYSFTYNLFSDMPKFDKKIFAAWFHSQKGDRSV